MTLSPLAAFLAGLVASLHCAGMCGPLACSVMPVGAGDGDPAVVAGAYHGARLLAYTALGALAGGLGRLPLALLPAALRNGLAWGGVLLFLALALRWDRRWSLPRFNPLPTLRAALGRRTRTAAAAALGLATPLLPCGPLYLLVPLALLSGSAARGGQLLLAFGLGTLPLLWIAQTQWGRWQRRMPPGRLHRLRIALALIAALVAAWRLRGTLGIAGGPANTWLCF
ncbi:MAG TPA: sulfite exporter TauE/SafE family protein [Opitutaceae bacterium]|jgi:hypothetical protein|nr:sulfite exporter TauE/SafE family protein [Opitutaceae bacterium]